MQRTFNISWTVAFLTLTPVGVSWLPGCSNGPTDEYHVVTVDESEASGESIPESVDTDPVVETDSNTDPDLMADAVPGEGSSSTETSAAELPADVSTDEPVASADPIPENPSDSPSAEPETSRNSSDAEPSASVATDEGESKPKRDDQISLASLSVEQQMMVLRARAAGEPIPDFSALSEPNEIKLLIPHNEFDREGPENALRISFDDIDLLKVLNMRPVPPDVMEHLPDWLKDLDGKRVILRGWMYPPGRTDKISRFMFVRDNGICCFERKPLVYDKLGVTMRDGKTTKYIQNRPFDVVATFRIEPDILPDGEVFWLYQLDDALVIDNKG